jgi:hypothetical protein
LVVVVDLQMVVSGVVVVVVVEVEVVVRMKVVDPMRTRIVIEDLRVLNCPVVDLKDN